MLESTLSGTQIEAFVLYLFITTILIILGGLILWNYLWLSQIDINYCNPFTQFNTNSKASFFTKLWNHIQILTKQQFNQLVHTLNFDSFAYLLLQRYLIKYSLICTFISLLLQVPFSLFLADSSNYLSQLISISDLNQGFFQILSIIFYSTLLTVGLIFFKAELKLLREQSIQAQDKNTKYQLQLQQRTVHVKGLDLNNNKQEALRNDIQSCLNQQFKGNILDYSIVVDLTQYQSLLQQELDIDSDMKIAESKKPWLYKFFEFISCKDVDHYQQQLDSIKVKIEQFKISQMSGHGFFCLDNPDAVQCLLDKYSLLSFKRCEQALCDDNVEDDNDQQDNQKIVMSMAPHPSEIYWLNMKMGQPIMFCSRLIFNVFILLILIFFTTPSSILHTLGFDSLTDESSNMGSIDYIFMQYLPTLLVVAVNSLILYLIQKVCEWETHYLISSFQKAMFTKCLLYLTLNMLVIPMISFSAVTSIYMLYTTNKLGYKDLSKVYFVNNANFFILLIIQQACFSSFSLLNQLPLLFENWGSTWLTHYKQTIINSHQNWMKKYSEMFPFGYSYAMMVTVMYIVMAFNSFVPFMHIAALVYFTLRHFVDSVNLMTFYEENLDSQGKLSQRVTICLSFGPVISQFLSFLENVREENVFSSIALFLIMASQVGVIIYFFRKDKIDFSKMEVECNLSLNQPEMEMWKENFQHPLNERVQQ